jgi:hypothetical protein
MLYLYVANECIKWIAFEDVINALLRKVGAHKILLAKILYYGKAVKVPHG